MGAATWSTIQALDRAVPELTGLALAVSEQVWTLVLTELRGVIHLMTPPTSGLGEQVHSHWRMHAMQACMHSVHAC